jgi:hypothetical protein
MATRTSFPPELAASLTGHWHLDRKQSDSIEPLLAFVGVPWLIRKAILAAPNPAIRVSVDPGTGAEDSHPALVVLQEGMSKMENHY